MRPTAQAIIDHLRLQPLPGEGGYFIETYRSPLVQQSRAASTAIYYLLTPETVSLFHRLKSDELWHFYQGDAVEQVLLQADGTHQVQLLGQDVLQGEHCQVLVPAGTWQGARLLAEGQWALMGCTVAPGFEFADWELGEREALLREYPHAAKWIEQLTK